MKNIKQRLLLRTVHVALLVHVPKHLHPAVKIHRRQPHVYHRGLGRELPVRGSPYLFKSIEWLSGLGIYDYMQLTACRMFRYGMHASVRSQFKSNAKRVVERDFR